MARWRALPLKLDAGREFAEGGAVGMLATQGISAHWIRHPILTWVERHFGYAVARAYAGHTGSGSEAGATATYVRASLAEVVRPRPHPFRARLHQMKIAEITSLECIWTLIVSSRLRVWIFLLFALYPDYLVTIPYNLQLLLR